MEVVASLKLRPEAANPYSGPVQQTFRYAILRKPFKSFPAIYITFTLVIEAQTLGLHNVETGSYIYRLLDEVSSPNAMPSMLNAPILQHCEIALNT